jgi:hypothetical protein
MIELEEGEVDITVKEFSCPGFIIGGECVCAVDDGWD